MRVFTTLDEALPEIRRDLYKSPELKFTRVQQHTGMDLKGHERLFYLYSIEHLPHTPEELILLGQIHEIPLFVKYPPDTIRNWMMNELNARLFPATEIANRREPIEKLHPILLSTLEGEWPSYTYTERTVGMLSIIKGILEKDPDSRRAFWPIFRELDSFRADAPTRVPCSLGYQFLIRNISGSKPKLIMIYFQRSADFDHFLLTDIWLAGRLQSFLAGELEMEPGYFIHFISSLHMFISGLEEIY